MTLMPSAIRWFLLSAFLVTPLSAEVHAADSAERPNFLIILCDDLGYGDLACCGNKTIQTPHLDKLAAQIMLTAYLESGSRNQSSPKAIDG